MPNPTVAKTKKKIVTVELFFYCDEDVDSAALARNIATRWDLLRQGGHMLAKKLSTSYGKEIQFTTVSASDGKERY